MTKEIRSIIGIQKEAGMKQMGMALNHLITLDWIFNLWYEKLILSACVLWSAYSFFKFIIGLF